MTNEQAHDRIAELKVAEQPMHEEAARYLTELLALRKLTDKMREHVNGLEMCANPECTQCNGRADLAVRFDALRKEW